MLDVGGGPGTYSVLLTQRFPGLRSEVLELPGVAAVARDLVAAESARGQARVAAVLVGGAVVDGVAQRRGSRATIAGGDAARRILEVDATLLVRGTGRRRGDGPGLDAPAAAVDTLDRRGTAIGVA
jgi:hypothetical protein